MDYMLLIICVIFMYRGIRFIITKLQLFPTGAWEETSGAPSAAAEEH
jgi:hypothetical protein